MKTQRLLSLITLLLIILSILLNSCFNKEPEDFPPACEILEPYYGDQIVKGTQLEIRVRAAAPNGHVQRLEVNIFPGGPYFSASHDPSAGNVYSFIWDTSLGTVLLGEHEIHARTIDNENVSATDKITIELIEDEPENTPPVAIITASQTSGTTTTNFTFDALESSDNEDPLDVLQVRWDWEGDGTWDTQYTTEKTANHQFSEEGTYHVKLEVKDTGELTDIDSVFVEVTDTGGNPGVPCPGVPAFEYEGQVYNPILIGDQCWLKENLDVGDWIFGDNEMSNDGMIEKYCYDDDPLNCDLFGGLYQWDEMMQYVTTEGAQGICPDGWHIPTDEEWKQLEGAVDSHYDYPDPQWDNTDFRGYNCGKNLKTTSGWSNEGNGIDLYGFSAFPAGWKGANDFYFITEATAFWTSSDNITIQAWHRQLYNNSDAIKRNNIDQDVAFSVRCVKD